MYSYSPCKIRYCIRQHRIKTHKWSKSSSVKKLFAVHVSVMKTHNIYSPNFRSPTGIRTVLVNEFCRSCKLFSFRCLLPLASLKKPRAYFPFWLLGCCLFAYRHMTWEIILQNRVTWMYRKKSYNFGTF